LFTNKSKVCSYKVNEKMSTNEDCNYPNLGYNTSTTGQAFHYTCSSIVEESDTWEVYFYGGLVITLVASLVHARCQLVLACRLHELHFRVVDFTLEKHPGLYGITCLFFGSLCQVLHMYNFIGLHWSDGHFFGECMLDTTALCLSIFWYV